MATTLQTHTDPVAEMPTPPDLAGGPETRRQGRTASEVSEWLTFKLGSEEYGIDILRVQEIRSYQVPTRIANAPAALKGVVNLRGVIVPIVDMRISFNLERPCYDEFTVVIVLNLGKQVVGMVIDAVSDVITLPADAIKAAPCLANQIQTQHLLGIGTMGDRTLMLDIEQIIRSEQMGLFSPVI